MEKNHKTLEKKKIFMYLNSKLVDFLSDIRNSVAAFFEVCSLYFGILFKMSGIMEYFFILCFL